MDQKTLTTLEYSRILAALAVHCHFNPARERAAELAPLSDLEDVQELQRETAEALALITLHPGTTIGGARDLRPIVEDALRGIVLEPTRLLQVKDTLVAARNLKRLFIKEQGEYPALEGLAGQLPESLGLVTLISQAISDQEEVLDSASEKLAQIRKDLNKQHNRLKSRMNQLLRKPEVAKFLQEPIVTQRNGRYVLPLKADARAGLPGIVHDQSTSGATIYVEPQAMVEANNRFRKLELDERDEVQRILAELTARVGEHGPVLQELVETLTRLDLAFGRGRYAIELKAFQPTLRAFPKKPGPGHPGVVLRLFGARHPLLNVKEVVPIDVVLDKSTYALIITGPNTGGKTVTLKTVGLLVLMAQTGLHIPASGASELSLFQDVYADIGDEQSIEQSLSTFSGHITNIIKILKKANRRSLVILDELGAGTDPQEGAALARSIMSNLLDRGITTLVTTHHPDLKVYAHSTPGVINASVEFDLKSLSPTYHLTVGLPGRSNALAIAGRLGLPDEIIESAKESLDPADLKADDLLDEIHQQRHMAEDARLAAESGRDEVEQMRVRLADRIVEVEEERLVVLEKTRREARKSLDKIKADLAEIKEDLKKEEDPGEKIDQLEKQAEQVEELISQPIPLRKSKLDLPQPSGPIQVGDKVYLRSLGKKGTVLSVNGDAVEVQVFNMRVRAQKADLEYTRESDAPEVVMKTQAVIKTPKEVVSPGMELDLRGQQVDEALENLGFFMDKAFLAGLP
ncbi:MAG: endonuclease MutS2, partial [Chloroflexi bacterium]|nr:endonuclease MutS2 [Chloroflexota bacterium]